MLMLLFAAVFAFACGHGISPLNYNDADLWFEQFGEVAEDVDSTARADVFYIISTEVVSSVDASGEASFNSTLTDEQRTPMIEEMKYMKTAFAEGYNYYSPFYRQSTLESFKTYDEESEKSMEIAYCDVKAAFCHYIDNVNAGRPYVLIGFSQGSIHALHLMEDLPASYFKNLRGAYLMGCGLRQEDVDNLAVEPMRSELEGIVCAYNSSTSPDIMWDALAKDCVATINPVNWRTDSTPANFTYDGEELTVQLDPASKMLIVSGLSDDKIASPMNGVYYPKGFLHHHDHLMYIPFIRENIQRRNH